MPQRLEHTIRLNRICPYFTRFPLQFPLETLRESRVGQWMLDPFCGSGTSLFAARLAGLNAFGVDSNRVAVVIARAKLCQVTPQAVIDKAAAVLKRGEPDAMPKGTFWERCYAPATLEALCRFRRHFMSGRNTPVEVTLCALLLGLLHGPNTDGTSRFFSNHLTADFAPPPQEAVRLWTQRNLKPPACNVLPMIQQRSVYLLAAQPAAAVGMVREGDSRKVDFAVRGRNFDWIITSPPYYGMDSYPTDQWLRSWLLGGSAFPEREAEGQIAQQTPDDYVNDLAKVWRQVAEACHPGARLIVRIGNVPGITAPPAVELFEASLNRASVGWKIHDCKDVRRDAPSQRTRTLFNSPAQWPQNETEVFVRLDR